METSVLIQKYESFNPEIKREIIDFIEYLEKKYKPIEKTKKVKKIPLDKESFIGIWKDRKETKNVNAYIQKIRKKHWNRVK